MKKYNYIMMIIATIGIAGLSGCFTSATAYTEKTAPDGTVTISKVSIKGTGDKASQVAAEGLFADGGVDDLGAGVKNANASQTSTGIDGTLKGMGDMFGGLAQLMAVMQTGGLVGAPKAVATPSLSSDSSLAPVVSANVTTKAKGQTVISGDGVPEIAILGNRDTCIWCNRLWSGLDANALSLAACGANIIDADFKDHNADYLKYKGASSGFDWPYVKIFVDGKVVSEFVARGMSQADIAAKASEVIGKCSDK